MNTDLPNRTFRNAWRTNARRLSQRVCVTGKGHVLLIAGDPDLGKFAEGLLRRHALHVPGPSSFGFRSSSIEALSPWGLLRIERTLARWQQFLRRRLATENRPRLRRRWLAERAEVERLKDVAAAIRSALRKPPGEPIYLLTTREAEQLKDMLRGAPPFTQWLLWMCAWIAGPNSAKRLRTAFETVPLDETNPEVPALRAFERRLQRWLDLIESETLDANQLPAMLPVISSELPIDLLKQGVIPMPVANECPTKQLRSVLHQCRQRLAQQTSRASRRVGAMLTALCALDGSEFPLPAKALKALQSVNDMGPRLIAGLYTQRTLPAYSRVLEFLDNYGQFPLPDETEKLYSMLAAGSSYESAKWIIESNHFWYVYEMQPQTCADEFRQVLTDLQDRGLDATHELISKLWCTYKGDDRLKLLQQFHRWAARFGRLQVTSRIRDQLWQCLTLLMKWPLDGHCQQVVQGWMRPPRSLRGQPRETRGLPYDLRVWFAGIQFYRRLAGHPDTLPKSLRRWFHQDTRRAVERDYLAERIADGTATVAMWQRWKSLSQSATEVAPTKLLRDAREVFLTSAYEALQVITERLIHKRYPLARRAGHLAASDRIAMCAWFDDMTESESRNVQQLLLAWDRHGPRMKYFLPGNTDWIAKRSWDVQAWLAPHVERMDLPAGTFTLEPAIDPLEVFQMGQRFDTCLSFGGCNDFAVLSNAYGANKLVVYLRDPDGRYVGRKLLAVAGANELLGYESFASIEGLNENFVIDSLDIYAARLAKRCGLVLADQGVPEDLGPFEWYDDGTVSWSHAAQLAWQRADLPRPRVPQRRALRPAPHPAPLLV